MRQSLRVPAASLTKRPMGATRLCPRSFLFRRRHFGIFCRAGASRIESELLIPYASYDFYGFHDQSIGQCRDLEVGWVESRRAPPGLGTFLLRFEVIARARPAYRTIEMCQPAPYRAFMKGVQPLHAKEKPGRETAPKVKWARSAMARRPLGCRSQVNGNCMPLIKKILFPVDFSDSCLGAARYVEAFAGRFEAEIMLLHALGLGEHNLAEELLPRRKAQLDAFLLDELKYFITQRLCVTGDPSSEIVDVARRWADDPVMMPTHGLGAFRRLLPGSVTAKVLHDLDCPSTPGIHSEAEPPLEQLQGRRILCAVDLTERSRSILDWAAWLAGEYQAVLGIVHATAELPAAFYAPTPATTGLPQDEESLAYEPMVRGSSEPQGWEWTT